MFEKTDQQLIDLALEGRKKGWIGIVKRYEKPVYNYALRMTGNSADAKDLMQEVFISAVKTLGNYRGEGSFKSWLFRIAHYRCIEFYRRRKPTEDLDNAPELHDESPHTDTSLIADQQNRSVIAAMQQLPVNQRAIVELKFFNQFTFDEIAHQLNLSSNTVKSRLYAALGKMKLSIEVDHV